MQLCVVGGRQSRAAPGWRGPFLRFSYSKLILLFANLFSCAFPSQRGFYTLFLTWFQVKGVALDFLNNIFLLHFALKAAQGVF
jgi:hypothetical protein